ncbi:MAG: sigma 54-interacting transcriptional regulator [Pseudomonadota bacterium]
MDSALLDRNWRRVLDTLRDGVVVLDPGGRVVMVNQAMCRLTGFSRTELLGQACTVFNCDACAGARDGGAGHWCELFAGAQPEDRALACTIIRKDGGCLPAIKTARLLRDARGRVMGAVETLADYSELERRDRKINELSRQLAREEGFMGMVGGSQAMEQVFNLVERAGLSEAPVIIHGESGTGKELVAKAIHAMSRRRERPHVVFNCAALSEALFESELFGHVKGAFTGAHRHRRGRLEEADGGFLFMDEIGELPLSGQVKLLRVLEQKSFERVGEQRPISVDVRFIAATNRDLEEMIQAGQFRHDLYYRLNVIPIFLPPLRRRAEDLPALVDHFLSRIARSTGKLITGVSSQVMERFVEYDWPGNVRQLRAALDYAFVVADHGRIQLHHLPPQLGLDRRGQAPAAGKAAPAMPGPGDGRRPLGGRPDDDALRRQLAEALKASGGNISQAARLLGVSRTTVWNRMHRLGVKLHQVVEETDGGGR